MLAGGFFRSAPPTPSEQWAAQADVRLVAAQSAALHLPWDSPPELVEAAAYDDKGDLVAADDAKRAHDALVQQERATWQTIL